MLKGVLKRREANLAFLILVLIGIVTLRAPHFMKGGNWYDILKDTSILIIVSLGQLTVILTGGIDLSVASNMALTGMACALLNQSMPELSAPLIIPISLACGTLLGMFNGLLVAYGNIPPIITTLGTISIYRGMVFVLSKGEWVSAHEMTMGFMNLPNARFLGLASLIWFAVIIAAAAMVFLNLNRHGRGVYAIGGNELAAEYVGLKPRRLKFLVFSISGAAAGFAGLMYVSQYASAQNETAVGLELQTVAACVIGGASTAGGSGNVVGVLLGALFLGIVNNALTVTNLSPFYQMAIQGLVILAAIVANQILAKRRGKETVVVSGKES